MEVEAIDEGVLVKIVVPEGTTDVPVNDVIGLIAGDGEDAKSVAGTAPPVAAKIPAVATAQRPAVLATAAVFNGQSGPRISASPLARRIAKDSSSALTAIMGTGPHGRIVERDVKAALARCSIRAGPCPRLRTNSIRKIS